MAREKGVPGEHVGIRAAKVAAIRKKAEISPRAIALGIYRKICRGRPNVVGALIATRVELERLGRDHDIEEVARWHEVDEWDKVVINLDAPVYAMLEMSKAQAQKAASKPDYDGVQAAISGVGQVAHQLALLAMNALTQFPPETMDDAVRLAEAATTIVERVAASQAKLLEVLPMEMRNKTAVIEGEVLAAREPPRLEGTLAAFERGAREGNKH